jgi:hypothetical protein
MKSKLLLLSTLLCVLYAPAVFATFNAPVPVQIGTNLLVSTPSFSSDQLTIFFSQGTAPSQFDIYYATRPNKFAAFGAPIPIPSINTDQMEWSSNISTDGLSLYFSRGYDWNGDIWVTKRTSLLDPFGAPQPVAELNTSYADMGPAISADGLTMYLCSTRLNGREDLFVATRSNISLPFSTPVALDEINTPQDDAGPTITPDGLTLYYRYRYGVGGTGSLQEIWAAQRPDTNSPFGTPYLVPELNTAVSDSSAPDVTRDGMRIYFTAIRPDSLPGNLWMATVIPEPSCIVIIISGLLSLFALKRKSK